MFSEINEVNKTTENSQDAESNFQTEMDDKYDRLLSGKSKEELVNLRSYLVGDENADTSDDEDKPKQRVKRWYD